MKRHLLFGLNFIIIVSYIRSQKKHISDDTVSETAIQQDTTPLLDINSVDNVRKVSKRLVFKDSGVTELKRGAAALIFYITTTNIGQDIIELSVEGKECCQKITAKDEDCESMQLIGGDMGALAPADTRNLTLLFPNLYLHDRRGTCKVSIISKEGEKLEYSIHFDTTLPKPNERVKPLLEDYFSMDDLKVCDSVDENPINDCQPAICLVKYNGWRNFFNHTTRRCEKVTVCTSASEEDSELPDIVYVPISNTCRKLSSHLSEDDLTSFKEGIKGETLSRVHGYPLNVQCHRGKPNPSNGWCECDPGWTSSPFDYATFNPDIMVYHMCTIWTGELSSLDTEDISLASKEKPNINIIILSVLSGILFIVIVIFVILFYLQSQRELTHMKNQDQDVTVDLLEEAPSRIKSHTKRK